MTASPRTTRGAARGRLRMACPPRSGGRLDAAAEDRGIGVRVGDDRQTAPRREGHEEGALAPAGEGPAHEGEDRHGEGDGDEEGRGHVRPAGSTQGPTRVVAVEEPVPEAAEHLVGRRPVATTRTDSVYREDVDPVVACTDEAHDPPGDGGEREHRDPPDRLREAPEGDLPTGQLPGHPEDRADPGQDRSRSRSRCRRTRTMSAKTAGWRQLPLRMARAVSRSSTAAPRTEAGWPRCARRS